MNWIRALKEDALARQALIMTFLICSGSFLMVYVWTGFPPIPVALGLAFVFAVLVVIFLEQVGGLVNRVTSLTMTDRKPVPLLSKARAKIKQELWDEARKELAGQWARFPGHLDVVREYERMFLDGLQAPSAAVKYFKESLVQVKGKDRAYVYLRIAELLSGKDLNVPVDARAWYRRLVAEFPESEEGKMAVQMLETIPKP